MPEPTTTSSGRRRRVLLLLLDPRTPRAWRPPKRLLRPRSGSDVATGVFLGSRPPRRPRSRYDAQRLDTACACRIAAAAPVGPQVRTFKSPLSPPRDDTACNLRLPAGFTGSSRSPRRAGSGMSSLKEVERPDPPLEAADEACGPELSEMVADRRLPEIEGCREVANADGLGCSLEHVQHLDPRRIGERLVDQRQVVDRPIRQGRGQLYAATSDPLGRCLGTPCHGPIVSEALTSVDTSS